MGLLPGLCCYLGLPPARAAAMAGRWPGGKAQRVRRVAGRLAARLELADELRRLGDW